MSQYWRVLDKEIDETPMPPEYQNYKVNVRLISIFTLIYFYIILQKHFLNFTIPNVSFHNISFNFLQILLIFIIP